MSQEHTIFKEVDGKTLPNRVNWNTVLRDMRDGVHDPCEVLGFYVASVTVERTGFDNLLHTETAFIEASEPPMTPQEVADFQTGFGRIGTMDDAFVYLSNIARQFTGATV